MPLSAGRLASLLAAASLTLAQAPGLPGSSLALRDVPNGRPWWSSDSAPTDWSREPPVLAEAIQWRTAAPGVEWGEARLAGTGEAHRIRLIAARLDPRRLRFRLDTAYTNDGYPSWSVLRAPREAVFAVNAGMFPWRTPWGWVVIRERQYLPPSRGPLSLAVIFDSSGSVRWLSGDSIGRRPRHGIDAAFQSYPTLLQDGMVPEPLRAATGAVSVTHRDARVALGAAGDGTVIVALTRYDGIGGVLDFVPFGLTVPEMAAVMGALGARQAVMLDGGISSQLLVRDGRETRRWPGLRRVPLGLVAVPR